MQSRLKDLVPYFKDADERIENDFQQNATLIKIPKGTIITRQGDRCQYFPIIKLGQVRVYKLGPRAQDMTLYRIGPGESCVLTISCILSEDNFPAIAYAEENCEAILVPSNILSKWVKEYSLWNSYLYNYLSKVLLKVIGLLEDITFKRVDIRIFELLVKNYIKSGKFINITHREIASEIGTAREVVSRILKELEKEDIIEMKRGIIVINNFGAIQERLYYIQ